MQYEAVQPISSWDQLKRRLCLSDRRVFSLTHPCLPGEPLVILHTALAHEPATALHQVLPEKLLQQQQLLDQTSDRMGVQDSTYVAGTSGSTAVAGKLGSTNTPDGLQNDFSKPSSSEQDEGYRVAIFYSISSSHQVSL
jgi:hypothetical protein